MSRYVKGGDVVRVPQINSELEKIEESQKTLLSREGGAGNQMNADIDMNSRSVINAASLSTYSLVLRGVPVTSIDALTPEPTVTAINVKDYGAVGDGVTDDTVAINLAVGFADSQAGGAKVIFPPGVYRCGEIDLTNRSNVLLDLQGATIKALDGFSSHLFVATNPTDCGIINGTLDQNAPSSTAGHGIRIDGCNGLLLQNLVIKNCSGYGVGGQGGSITGLQVNNVRFNNLGLDAIDIKDFNTANEGITISNLVIENIGNSSSNPVGVDIRGPAVVNNVKVYADKPNVRAVRFRQASVQGRSGKGAFSNIYYKGDGVSGGQYALDISTQGGLGCIVSDVLAEDCGLIGVISSDGGVFNNIVGINIRDDNFSIFGSNNIFTNISTNSGSRFIDMEAGASNNIVSNFVATGLTSSGIRVQPTAVNNTFKDGVMPDFSISVVEPNEGTVIENVIGSKTEEILVSGPLALDSIGTRSFVFTHSLNYTPEPQDISLSVIYDTDVNDALIDSLRLTGNPTSTSFGSKFNVRQATVTGSTTARIMAKVQVRRPAHV